MAEVTVTLADDHIKAIEWAAARDPENQMTVAEYISFVMVKAAESYARQAEAADIDTLGRAALSEQKASDALTRSR